MTSTAASALQVAIDRLVASARERGAGPGRRRGGPFRYYALSDTRELDAAVKGAPGELRLRLAGNGNSDLKSEVCTLQVGNVRFVHFMSEATYTADRSVDPDYLMLFCILRGERTFFAGGVPVATAWPGDYVFIVNRSPMFRFAGSGNTEGLAVYIRIPDTQRFALGARRRDDDHIRSFLDHGFVIGGPSPLWGIHLTYALSYALDAAALVERGEDLKTAGDLLGEHLYLLFRQELAHRAEERDAERQYVAVPLKLRVAETYVAANAANAPTVEDVAGTAGLSVRSLHTLFVKFRGMSPGEFIRERRLTGVRTALRQAAAGATVTEIATAWSFQNFGNFASAYRERFGELPSETLTRRGGR